MIEDIEEMNMITKVEKLTIVKSGDMHLDLKGVIEDLRVSREVSHNIRQGGAVRELPSPRTIMDIVDGLCVALFPTHLNNSAIKGQNVDLLVSNSLNTSLNRLVEQVRRGLQFDSHDLQPKAAKSKAFIIVRDFSKTLPAIRAQLVADLRAAYRSDPAAGSIAEILLCYRGATAVIYHRLAHALHVLGARLVPRMISDLAHAATGIDIHPGASIGEGFFIDHGTGVVIGETAIIGRNVRIYQGVTLGAKNLPEDAEGIVIKGQPRHPIIGDNVVIYAGATILGRIEIGDNSVIGGNVWLTESVPMGSTITQHSTRRTS